MMPLLSWMDLQSLPPPQDTDIDIGTSRISTQDVEHIHAKNIMDLNFDDHVVCFDCKL
jgi:hypothetical protein